MVKEKNKVKIKNYLDYIPVHNERHKWDLDEDGNITIYVENKGVFNRLAQKFLGKPKISQIHLDEMGNFIWSYMDGTYSLYEIAQFVHEEFGEKAEPLYSRFVQYVKNLEKCGFIYINQNDRKD